jgi:nucleotide-binding universal stress UspA family protein
MKKILVPTNFSTQAGWAMEIATYLTRKTDAALVLLHVVEYPVNESFDVEGDLNDSGDGIQNGIVRKLIRQNKTYLNELSRNLAAIGVSTVNVIRYGNLLHAIKTTAFDYNVDLVVMGTTKRSKIEEVLDGSKTEQVVKVSQAPVLAIREKPSDISFRNIVYATSVNANGTFLPEIVTSAQKLDGAKLHIATVHTPDMSLEEIELKNEMESFARKNELANYSINVIDSDSEEAGIIRFAKEVRADLIVLSTRGRTELAHEVRGNIPQDLVNHSTIPVLTYLASA